MCSPVRCGICGKITWSGCGLHVEQALAGVPVEQRCPGHTQAEVDAAWASRDRR
jgi:hypothetical protein